MKAKKIILTNIWDLYLKGETLSGTFGLNYIAIIARRPKY